MSTLERRLASVNEKPLWMQEAVQLEIGTPIFVGIVGLPVRPAFYAGIEQDGSLTIIRGTYLFSYRADAIDYLSKI